MKTPDLFPGFRTERIPVAEGIGIQTIAGGSGPPRLLLHGHPQTHAIRHRVAPERAAHYTVVACDLRGDGDSSKPPGDPDAGRRLGMPLMAPWGGQGVVHRCFEPLEERQRMADALLERVLPFLARS